MSEGATISSEVLTLLSAPDLTVARALKETFADAQLSRTDGVVEGPQGFASARRWRRSAATKVDPVITDVNMPNIDGITLSRNCKCASASWRSSAFLGFRRTRRPCRTSKRRWRSRGARGIVLENPQPLLGFEPDGRIASHFMIVAAAVIANASCKTRSRTRMRVETTVNAGVFEAKLIDQMMFSDHRAFRTLLKEISHSGAKKCIFNLAGLTSIDSSGLGMFMVALDEARKGRWTLTIKSPQGHVKSLLVLGRFDKLLTIEA